MFPGFNRHELLVEKYRREVRSWFPVSLEPYEPESADDLDEYYYLAAGMGEGHHIAPSGKVWAFWTSNQTDHDMQRDEAWNEAVEEVFEEKGGCADWYDGYLLYVECHAIPKIPRLLNHLISVCRADLYDGPIYLNKHGDQVSMFDEDCDHQFDFSRAMGIIRRWFDDHFTFAGSERIIRDKLGSELASYL